MIIKRAFRLVPNHSIKEIASYGVPMRVLLDLFPRDYKALIRTIEYNTQEKAGSIISPKRQINGIEKSINQPIATNYVLGLSARPNDRLASQIALKIFITAYLQTANSINYPIWHSLDSSAKDSLRDEENQIGASPCLVVFSNIAVNSTIMKFEKLRDLLEKYSQIPRIVVAAGTDPLTLFAKHLFVSVNRLGYFGESI